MSATVTRRFDSLSAIIDYAGNSLPKSASQDASEILQTRRSAPYHMADWFGMPASTSTPPNVYAADMLTNGWQEGVERMQAAIDTLTPPPSTNARRRACWSDAGDSIDMQRVYSGNLDAAWRKCTRQSARAPRPITIWLPMALPSKTASDVIFWRGAAVSVLADTLQQAGYSVAVNGYMNGFLMTTSKDSSTHPQIDMTLTIKPHRSPMDIGTLAAATALPAMVRGIYYGALCIAGSIDGHKIKHGLSYHSDRNEYADMQPGDIGGARTVSTQADAQRWIAEAMEQLTKQTTNE
jgi:hypothetical protein